MTRKISRLLLSCLILVALGTYCLPVIRVTLPVIGAFSWSMSDFVKPVLKSAGRQTGQAKPKSAEKKEKINFFEVLKKILPKNPNNEPKKLSLTFVLGILVPVALFASYAFLLVGLLLVWILKNAAGIKILSQLTVFASAYALIGTVYLGKAAQMSFSRAVDKTGQDLLGFIAKNFVSEITIGPDQGLYVLVALSVFLLIVSWVPVKGK